MLCLFLLIIGRIVNVAVPFLFAGLVYVFEQGVTSPPWLLLLGYVGLRFLQSSGGLPALRDVRRTCLLSHSRPVHMNRLYPDFLDPGVAIFGSRCVRWMFMWISVLFSSLEMSLLSFHHLLHLSFAWHTHRNTGEVLKILDRGAAINSVFQVRGFPILI